MRGHLFILENRNPEALQGSKEGHKGKFMNFNYASNLNQSYFHSCCAPLVNFAIFDNFDKIFAHFLKLICKEKHQTPGKWGTTFKQNFTIQYPGILAFVQGHKSCCIARSGETIYIIVEHFCVKSSIFKDSLRVPT